MATNLRRQHGTNGVPLPKKPEIPPRAAFSYAREFTTEEELQNIALDLDAMRIQSLLICERVLGPAHKDTLFRLMYRGAAYADDFMYQRCIDLWRRALEIRVEKDSVSDYWLLQYSNRLLNYNKICLPLKKNSLSQKSEVAKKLKRNTHHITFQESLTKLK